MSQASPPCLPVILYLRPFTPTNRPHKSAFWLPWAGCPLSLTLHTNLSPKWVDFRLPWTNRPLSLTFNTNQSPWWINLSTALDRSSFVFDLPYQPVAWVGRPFGRPTRFFPFKMTCLFVQESVVLSHCYIMCNVKTWSQMSYYQYFFKYWFVLMQNIICYKH